MAWNQPGNSNNNPWGKKPPAGGNDFDQTFKDWQKRVENLFGGGGGRSSLPLLIIAIIILAGWMATGFYTITPGSKGVVQRFGKYVQTVQNGWGWRMPWPIESVTKVDTSGLKQTSYKSRVLTAEPNIVEIEIAVQFRIKSAEDYLFKVREPEITLSEVAESAIREVIGRNNLDTILGGAGRVPAAANTRMTMQEMLDRYGTGIDIESVNITDVQVPEAVQPSQLDSVKADADKERMVKEAQANANLAIPQAEGQAESRRRAAAAYKEQLIQRATGDASRFTQLLAAYEKAPAVTRERLYLEAIEDVMSRSRKVIVDPKSGNGNMIYLPLDKLIDRNRDADSSTVTIRPTVTVEPETPVTPDGRQRVDR